MRRPKAAKPAAQDRLEIVEGVVTFGARQQQPDTARLERREIADERGTHLLGSSPPPRPRAKSFRGDVEQQAVVALPGDRTTPASRTQRFAEEPLRATATQHLRVP